MFTPALDTEGLPINGDFSLLGRDFSELTQVRAARAAGAGIGLVLGHDSGGREVVAAAARVEGPGWLVVVELPMADAGAPAR